MKLRAKLLPFRPPEYGNSGVGLVLRPWVANPAYSLPLAFAPHLVRCPVTLFRLSHSPGSDPGRKALHRDSITPYGPGALASVAQISRFETGTLRTVGTPSIEPGDELCYIPDFNASTDAFQVTAG